MKKKEIEALKNELASNILKGKLDMAEIGALFIEGNLDRAQRFKEQYLARIPRRVEIQDILATV